MLDLSILTMLVGNPFWWLLVDSSLLFAFVSRVGDVHDLV